MAKNPSSRLYWKDWRGDTAVQSCSDAAQGFWAWLLCLCAEAGGYLLIAGKAPTIAELARLRGREPRLIGRQLAELERHGVFSRTEDGTIYNRRMVREAADALSKKTGKSPKNPERSQPDLLANSTSTHARVPATKATRPQESLSLSDPLPSPEAARDEEKSYEDESCKRAARAFGGSDEGDSCCPPGPVESASRSRPPPHEPPRGGEADQPRMETPARVGLVGANVGGRSDGRTSLPYPLAGSASSPGNPPRRGSAAETTEPGSLPAAHSQLEPEGQADYDPQREPSMDPTHLRSPRRAAPRTILGAISVLGRPSPPAKSPALKAKIKTQLRQKHARFLMARKRPEEVAAYWIAMLGDDQVEAQRMFDAVDRRMRAERWDNMREWRPQPGWRAIGGLAA